MPSIFDSIQQQVTATAVQQISQRFGIDPAVAQRTVNMAIPVITAAIASHARSGGAQAIHREATNQAITQTQSASLPEVFGDQHSAVEQRVSEATGNESRRCGRGYQRSGAGGIARHRPTRAAAGYRRQSAIQCAQQHRTRGSGFESFSWHR